MKKRIILTLLVLSMLLPTFASCSGADGSNNTDTETTSEALTDTNTDTAPADTASETEKETTYFDDILPEADYSGKTFTILHRPSASAHDTMPDFSHEEITGEPVDDAVFTQVTSVEDKYGVKVAEMLMNDVPSAVVQNASAGDDTASIVIHTNVELANLVTQNVLLDLNKLENICRGGTRTTRKSSR